MIRDRNIAWNRKRVFIQPRVMAGVLDDGTSGIPASLGAGAPIFAEAVAAAELMGLSIAASGDEVYHFWPIPWDMDVTQPLRFRVWFVHTAAAADTGVDWLTAYKAFGKADAMTDAKSSPDETVTFAAHTTTATANSIEVTKWAESASETKITSTDIGILLGVECDDIGTASANEIILLGLEIEYTVGAAPNQARLITDNAPTTYSGPNS